MENTIKKTLKPICLAGSELGAVRHVCAFFHSDDEEYRVLLPFIKDGFECGDKALHFVNSGEQHNHLRRLSQAGIDTVAATEKGQLELRTSTETYLRNGHFDQDRMLQVFAQLAGDNDNGRFSRSVASSATWNGRPMGTRMWTT